jgi:hypothetical protein
VRVRSALIGLLANVVGAIPLHAQAISVAGREIQVHWYLSEGFASSTGNNFLTMDTSRGSLFTEAGINVSTKVTPRLRVGAQLYDRYMGELGKGRVYVDWAEADFRLKDWIGFRGGKVKSTIGLYTDTQDQAFLRTWALMPQSVYPADLRSINVAHLGGDIYGHVTTARAGSFAYTGFAGSIPNDPHGGFLYGIEAQGGTLTADLTGRIAGVDVRWDSPVAGLMVGTSLAYTHLGFTGTLGASPLPLSYSTKRDRVSASFAEYSRGNFHADAEYRAHVRDAELTAEIPGRPVVRRLGSREPAWFTSAAYRLSKWIEVGGYYSHYHVTLINPTTPVTGPGRDHIFDKAVTARVDLARFWSLKVEGHFMDGVGAPGQAHGFYPQQNPLGFQPTTNLLVIRTSLYF